MINNPNGDLISRSAFKTGVAVFMVENAYLNMTALDALKMVADWIDEAPVVDPVQHGRWIGLEYDGYADGFPVYDLWECSECSEEVGGQDIPETHPWCHACGAKIDGGVEDA